VNVETKNNQQSK